MKKTILCGFALLSTAFSSSLAAQFLAGPLPAPEKSIRQNSVSIMGAAGDTVWIGPRLNFTYGQAGDWEIAPADSLKSGRFSLFSIALDQGKLVAGLGFYKDLAGSQVPTAGGFYTSADGGQSFTYRPAPVDPQGTIARFSGTDSLRGYFKFRYGGRDILALAVTVPEQSVPWDTDVRGSTLFTAAWASGLRRSLDFGATWQRILLPPYEQPALTPASTYNFIYQPTPPRPTDVTNPNTNESWTNFLGFSVFIDSRGRVWSGTAGGLNRSNNAMTAPTDSIAWEHAVAGHGAGRLPGNWIISITENPADSSIWMTNWIGTNSSGVERFAISRTTDGRTFSTFLEGEKIYEIAFHQGVIAAAGDNGLFLSRDNGVSWQVLRGIRSSNNVIPESAVFQAVVSAGSRLWAGTSEGLAHTTDLGKTWQIVRTNYPLTGSNQWEEGGRTLSYAYPNPFSVRQHQNVRIRFQYTGSGTVRIRLFDTSMKLIRELAPAPPASPGEYEVLWDGANRYGQQVSNGVVFYHITGAGRESRGKILMLD